MGEGSRDTLSHFMLQKLVYTPTGCVARLEYRLIVTCRPFTTRELCSVFVVVFRPIPDEDEQNKSNPGPLLTLNGMILFITYSPLFVSTGSSEYLKRTLKF